MGERRSAPAQRVLLALNLRRFLYNRHWYRRPFRLLWRLFRVDHPFPLGARMSRWPAVAVSNLVANCLFAIEWWFNKIDKQFDGTDSRVARNKLRASKPATKTSALHLLTPELLNDHQSIEGLVVFRRWAEYPNQPWSNRSQIRGGQNFRALPNIDKSFICRRALASVCCPRCQKQHSDTG